MEKTITDANDGSVKEIAVDHENPISTDPAPPAKRSHGSAAHSAPFEGITISVCGPPTDQSETWEIIDEDENPFVKRGLGRPPKVITAEAATNKIVKLALDKLLAHPLNEKLYGATSPKEINELAESIKEVGQQVPLVVTANLEKVGYYTLLSGHKRAAAMNTLDWKEASCQVLDVQDPDDRLLRLLEANRQHVPTTEQKIRIGEVYFELETKKAKARQVTGAKTKKGVEVVETLTQPVAQADKANADNAGKARDLAAAKVGMSGVSFDKGRKVLRSMEKAEAEGKTASVIRLRELLNEKGIDPAYEHAKVLNFIEKASKQGSTHSKAQGNAAAAKGVGAPHEPVPNAIVPEDNPSAPTLTETVVVALDDTSIAEVPEQATSDASRPEEKLVEIVDDGEQPPGVRLIALGEKFVEELEGLDFSDLTADLKRNLRHTLDDVENWHAEHDEMLRLPSQL